MNSSPNRGPRPLIKVEMADPAYHTYDWAVEEVKFGVPLSEALKDHQLPTPLVEMLVYIAQEGVKTSDLFRRPGNPTDTRVITKKLTEGREVQLTNYNFYTLASVIKKFLLKIPGGILGPDVEKRLLHTLEKEQRMEQYDAIHSIISTLPEATQHLLALLFGTWFRIVNHSEFNAMSSEAVAKSVAGSLFHTCADDPRKIQKAVDVLQVLIDDFGVANMFGRKNIQYFADMTRTGIKVREKFRYEYKYPATDSTQSSQRHLELFALSLQKEAERRGFNLLHDAISEEEFYGGGPGSAALHSRRGTAQSQGSSIEMCPASLQPSPPSPAASLQQHHPDHPDFNPHKKLTHVSSLSAPEVNKGYSPTQELSPANKRMYLSTSLNKFDSVKRRQMLRMKKRSNWFLTQSSSGGPGGTDRATSMETDVGSMTGSVGAKSSKSSIDDVLSSEGALSSSAGGADLTGAVSEDGGAISDTCPDENTGTPRIATITVVQQQQEDDDIVNGNHHHSNTAHHHINKTTTATTTSSSSPSSSTSSSTPIRTHKPTQQYYHDVHHIQTLMVAQPAWDTSSQSRSPSPNIGGLVEVPQVAGLGRGGIGTSSSSGSEREVRYYMVENYYGGSVGGGSGSGGGGGSHEQEQAQS